MGIFPEFLCSGVVIMKGKPYFFIIVLYTTVFILNRTYFTGSWIYNLFEPDLPFNSQNFFKRSEDIIERGNELCL